MQYRVLSVLLTEIIMGVLLFFMLFPQQGMIGEIVWLVCALIFLLYLPGCRLSFVFFGSNEVSTLERFFMSFLISVTLIVLFAYSMYYSGYTLSSMTVYVFVFGIIIISAGIALIRWRDTGVVPVVEE